MNSVPLNISFLGTETSSVDRQSHALRVMSSIDNNERLDHRFDLD